jgi:enoyl-CoA hydratase/carnithine racemase
MTDLIHDSLDPQVARRAVLQAERFDGARAVHERIVEAVVDADRLLENAIARANRSPVVSRQVMAATKANLHARALSTLGSDPASALLVAAVLTR